MPVRNRVQNFADYTSMPGLARIPHITRKSHRAVWVVALCIAWIVFGSQVYTLVTNYFAYPKTLITEITANGVPFPDITLCNLGGLDTYARYKIGTALPEYLARKDSVPNTDADSKEAFTDNLFVQGIYKYYGIINQDAQAKFNDRLVSRTTLAATVPQRNLSANGYQEDHFIFECSFQGRPCTFKKIFDPNFFNCYTFTANNPDGPTRVDPYNNGTKLIEGVENGFTVTVMAGSNILEKLSNPDLARLPGMYAYESTRAGSSGVRLVIHPPGTQPFPSKEGYDIPPGYLASLSLALRRRLRLPAPHGQCNTKYPFLNDEEQKLAGRYRKTACEQVCIQNHIHRLCNCYSNTLITKFDLLSSDQATAGNKKGEKQRDTCFTKEQLQKRSDRTEDECIGIEECSGTSDFRRCMNFDDLETTTCEPSVLQNLVDKIRCADRVRFEAVQNASGVSQLQNNENMGRAQQRQDTDLGADCSCHPACDDIQYGVAYSLAQWPGPGIDSAVVTASIGNVLSTKFNGEAKKSKFYSDYIGTNPNHALMDFAKINVYVGDANVFLTTEEPVTSFTQLISEIGGEIGLWIGVSVITIIEIVELLVQMLLDYLPSKRANKEIGTIKEKESPEDADTESVKQDARGEA